MLILVFYLIQIELAAKMEQIAALEERLAKAEAANDALKAHLETNQVRLSKNVIISTCVCLKPAQWLNL